MFRSNWFFKRFHTLVAPAIALALVVAAFFFTGQQSVTVAKAAANTQQTFNPLPSFVLDIIGTGSGAQSLAPVLPSIGLPPSDLGSVYVQGIIGSYGQVLAPVLPPIGLLSSDQGAMYLRDIVGIDIGGQSLAPVLPSIGLPASASSDLGSTYLRDIVGIDIGR
jgi:hypothetical protein